MKNKLQVFSFKIDNAAKSGEVDIYIDGYIVDAESQQIMKDYWGDTTSVSFKSFREQYSAAAPKVVNVYVSSLGGHLGDALAIHDLLQTEKSKGVKVNTIATNIVASAGTHIVLAGDSPKMTKNAWFMIHTVSSGMYGNVNEMERFVATMRQWNDQTVALYARLTGQTKEKISEWMDNETWFNADEAKEAGFIKEIVGEVEITNTIPADQWVFNNRAILNQYNAQVKPPHTDDEPVTKSFLSQKLDDMKKFFAGINNALKSQKPAEGQTTEEFVTQVINAIQAPFTELENNIEAEIKNQVTAAVGTAVATAVSNAVSELNTQISGLVKQIGELKGEIEGTDEEIVQKLGGKTTPPANEGAKPKIANTWRIDD